MGPDLTAGSDQRAAVWIRNPVLNALVLGGTCRDSDLCTAAAEMLSSISHVVFISSTHKDGRCQS